MTGPAYGRCEDCGAAIFPARAPCPACGTMRVAPAVSAGSGVVYSTTTVHARDGAYDVSLVDLDEGFRMLSTVRCESVRIGMCVRARDDGERIVFDAA